MPLKKIMANNKISLREISGWPAVNSSVVSSRRRVPKARRLGRACVRACVSLRVWQARCAIAFSLSSTVAATTYNALRCTACFAVGVPGRGRAFGWSLVWRRIHFAPPFVFIALAVRAHEIKLGAVVVVLQGRL